VPPPRAASRLLLGLLLLYAVASLLHFAHNAERLSLYPNLPPSLTRASVYGAWCALGALGLLGYGLYRCGLARLGLTLLLLYALCGFDGLLHYQRASFAAHSPMMNFTILTEVCAAALLCGAVLVQLLRPAAGPRPRRPPGTTAAQ
jgi:uncharacterized membrane protein